MADVPDDGDLGKNFDVLPVCLRGVVSFSGSWNDLRYFSSSSGSDVGVITESSSNSSSLTLTAGF